MALYKTPKAAIIGAIKALNGVVLLENEYIFGVPTPVELGTDGTNTSISITARDANSTFDGNVTVRYIRLALSDLLVLVPATLQIPAVANTLEFAQVFNRVYGTAFEPADIINEPVILVNGSGDVTLNAKPDSLGWTGSVTFSIAPGRMQISDYVTVTTLPGLNFPDPYLNKPFGWAYSYWRNFTPVDHILVGLSVADPDWGAIKDALVEITGDPWTVTGQSRYSLQGATFDYMGDVSGVLNANTDYQHIVVLTLGADCLGYSGRMYFHWNTPETDI